MIFKGQKLYVKQTKKRKKKNNNKEMVDILQEDVV